MKVTLEFNTSEDGFDICEYQTVLHANDLAFCLCKIKDQLREWYKYDTRGQIPFDEVYDTLNDIILEHVDMEKLGY